MTTTKETTVSTNNAYARRVQSISLEMATRYGFDWTTSDIDFVIAFRKEATIFEIAKAIGRTYYAVSYAVSIIDEREVYETRRNRFREMYEIDGDNSFGSWARAYSRD